MENISYYYKYIKYKSKYNQQKKIIQNNISELKNNEVIKKINILNYKLLKKKELLGEGRNGAVYKCLVDQKLMIVKEQKLHSDGPYIADSPKEIVCSVTGINELVISHYISKLSKYYDHIQKFYGYNIHNNNLLIFKEYIYHKFTTKYDIFTDYEKSLIILHCLLTLHETFQNEQYILGHHNDFRPNNIIFKEVKYKERTCIIEDITIRLPVKKYIPVLIDFGSTELIKCFGKSINIKRFNWRLLLKNKKDDSCFNVSKFNPCIDVQRFFYKLGKDSTLLISNTYNDLVEKYGENKVTVKHIFSHPNMKSFLSQF